MAGISDPKVVGVLGVGHMGSGVAADLTRTGLEVVTLLKGRSQRSAERARAAGAVEAADLSELVARCDTFLSIVPADQAEPLADEVAEALAGGDLHYVDCNSITPSKTARIAERVTAAGAVFSDGGIIGPPPVEGAGRTSLYVSGPASDPLMKMQSTGMKMVRLGDGLTEATEMKVLFAACNKGAVALIVNNLAAARHRGLLDKVTEELLQRTPGLLDLVRSQAGSLGDKAGRWSIEMRDLAEGLREMGALGGFHDAAADGYQGLSDRLDSAVDPTLDAVLGAWIEK